MKSSRVSDRLEELRRSRFVGRDREQTLFQSALDEAQLPWHLLYIYGSGGVGKTTLLREFAYICEQAKTPVVYLDTRNVEPSPDSFFSALQMVIGLEHQNQLWEWFASQPGHCVILIDTYETLTPLEDWLREFFLPQLPENALVVLAGRQPPSSAWRADPGWQALMRLISLDNLNPEESRTYLTKRQIPVEQHSSVLNFTRGHPLAMSLVADVFAQHGNIDFRPEAAPDVVKTLLEQFVQEVPSPLHRAALEVCALVRLTTEALLCETLAIPDAYELFNWLRGLSFIESRLQGIFPHDLAREAISADLRWRNPERYAELFGRARGYYCKRILQTQGSELERALFDYVFKSPQVRQFFIWQDNNLLTDTLRQSDRSVLMEMVTTHEGEASAQLLAHWLARQPQGVLVFRQSEEGTPLGFMMMLTLDEASLEDLQVDPATQAVWNYIQQQGALQLGEKATFCRFWMAADTYQAVSQIQSLIFIKIFRHCVTTPGLAFIFTAIAQPDFWELFCTAANMPLLPETSFEVGGRRYGVSAHNYRVSPVFNDLLELPAWAIAIAPPGEGEIRQGKGIPIPHSSLPLPNSPLSQSEFASAVHQALRDFVRPEALLHNPLARSHLVIERAGTNTRAAERIAALQALLQEAVESLQRSPREAKFYRALDRAYLHPAPSQERAAEILDISIGTFRRHLKAGIVRVTEILWHQEIDRLEN